VEKDKGVSVRWWVREGFSLEWCFHPILKTPLYSRVETPSQTKCFNVVLVGGHKAISLGWY
jgi:hypothetical protein